MTRAKKTSLIILIVFLIALFATAYFAYPIIKDRYFTKSKNDSQATEESQQNANGQAAGETTEMLNDLVIPESSPASDESGTDLNRNTPPQNGDVQANITSEHCDTDCQAFADDQKLLEYCQQVCGIAPESTVSNCDGKSGLEKDYCLKDLAIGKKDSSVCKEISDANIKKTCKDRILEDFLEEQTPSPSTDY